jgi:hypothetical protein
MVVTWKSEIVGVMGMSIFGAKTLRITAFSITIKM